MGCVGKNAKFIGLALLVLFLGVLCSYFSSSVFALQTLSVQPQVLQRVVVVGASSSSNDGGFPPSSAIDGIESLLNGWWSAYGTSLPQWLKLDLGSLVSINQVVTHFYDGDARTYTYYVEVSTDGSSWVNVVPVRTGNGSVTDTFPTVTARFVRITVTGNTANKNAHIIETSVYSPSGSEARVVVVGASSSSNDGGFPPSSAIDGIESLLNGWWSAYGTSLPQWLKLDLGSLVSINQVVTHFYDGDARTYTYYVEVSTDGSSWVNVVPVRTGNGSVTDTFPTVTARFVRITVTGNTANKNAHIIETSVYSPSGSQPPSVQPQVLQGVAITGFLDANPAVDGQRKVNPAYYSYDAKKIASWNASFVREGFNSYWYRNDARYKQLLRQEVENLTSNGLYVVMDLHSYGSPPVQGPYGTLTDAQARSLYNADQLPTLVQVAKDYLNNSKVIGVEVNEFWPLADRSASWPLELELGNTLARSVHQVNPSLYVFIDIYGEWVSDAAIRNGVSLITEPNIVFAPHLYCGETPGGVILHPTQPIKYGSTEGWDYYYAYQSGDLAGGKTKLYHWLDLYEQAIQNIYHVPFVVTEFASSPSSGCTQALRDMIDYFKGHSWGFSYSPYYGADEPSTQLLKGDWSTLTAQGQVLVSKLG